jgi:GTPase SAR1 family protein
MIIIVIGLPCSGKTTFLNSLKGYEIFDDFLSNMYDGMLLDALESKKNVCVADPRLCNFDTFKKHVNIFETYGKVLLILFENKLEKCLKNLKSRGGKDISKEIAYFHKLYNVYRYKEWSHIIMDIKDAS